MSREFINRLADTIYTEENIQRANHYLQERKIDSSWLRYPCTLTGGDEIPFLKFREEYRPIIFTDCLFMPITAIEDSSKLVGFDVRYCGKEEFRTRFVKFKDFPETNLVYYSKSISEISKDEPIIVTEGYLDAVSVSSLGHTVLSFLNAMSHRRFCFFLYAISKSIYIMYDNDDAGRKAFSRIDNNVKFDSFISNSFHSISFSGAKDPNEFLIKFGPDMLNNIIQTSLSKIC